MTALLPPPNPGVRGPHYVQRYNDVPVVWLWDRKRRMWASYSGLAYAPDTAAGHGYRYVCPIPSAAQLQAMGEIMHFFACALAEHELVEGPVADEQPIWTGYEFRITAGTIRRANEGS